MGWVHLLPNEFQPMSSEESFKKTFGGSALLVVSEMKRAKGEQKSTLRVEINCGRRKNDGQTYNSWWNDCIWDWDCFTKTHVYGQYQTHCSQTTCIKTCVHWANMGFGLILPCSLSSLNVENRTFVWRQKPAFYINSKHILSSNIPNLN